MHAEKEPPALVWRAKSEVVWSGVVQELYVKTNVECSEQP